MKDLKECIKQLRAEFPSVDLEFARGDLKLRRGETQIILKGSEDIAALSAEERQKRRVARQSFLDLTTGTLFVDDEEVLIYLQLKRKRPLRLTGYQCALLGTLLTSEGWKWFVPASEGPQVDLIALIRLELGVEISPMAMSRFLESLRSKKLLVKKGGKALMDLGKALQCILEDFRISMVGAESLYAGTHQEVESVLMNQYGGQMTSGVASRLAKETNVWIEPRDYIVDRSVANEVRSALGGVVSKGYRGEVVSIRVATRIPLPLITGDFDTIQPLLAIAAARASTSPVARETAEQVLQAWKRRIVH